MPLTNAANVNLSEVGHRLTLTSGIPVTSADVVTATTIYMTPYTSTSIALFVGSSWQRVNSPEVSLALGTLTTSTNFDVFAFYNGATVSLEVLAWTGLNTRVALGSQDGVPVKGGDPTRRLIGVFRTTNAGQTEDSLLRRYLSNLYNQRPRGLAVAESTNSWTYVNPNSVWRQARATATNTVQVVMCDVRLVSLTAAGALSTAGTASFAMLGIGVDSTTTNLAVCAGAAGTAGSITVAYYADYPTTPGYHAYNWLETGTGAAQTYTFYGNAGTTILKSGIVGSILN